MAPALKLERSGSSRGWCAAVNCKGLCGRLSTEPACAMLCLPVSSRCLSGQSSGAGLPPQCSSHELRGQLPGSAGNKQWARAKLLVCHPTHGLGARTHACHIWVPSLGPLLPQQAFCGYMRSYGLATNREGARAEEQLAPVPYEMVTCALSRTDLEKTRRMSERARELLLAAGHAHMVPGLRGWGQTAELSCLALAGKRAPLAAQRAALTSWYHSAGVLYVPSVFFAV